MEQMTMYRPILLNANQFCPVKNELMTKLDNSKTFTWNGTLSFNPKRIFAEHWTWHCIENPFYSHSHIFHSPSLSLFIYIFFALFCWLCACIQSQKAIWSNTLFNLQTKCQIPVNWKAWCQSWNHILWVALSIIFFFSLKHRRAINTDTCDWTC